MKYLVLFLSFACAGCLSTPPPHPRALEANELCTLYIGQADLTRAEVQCDLGLEFSPQYSDLWVNKGLIALRRGNDKLAKEHFIKALRYNQEQAQAYNNLGYVYFKSQEYGKAHDNFQRALKVNPDYIEARYNLALAYRSMDQKDKAKKELRTIIAVNNLIADAHATLGSILHEEGANEEAVEALQTAVQLDAKFAGAWLELGNTFADMGKHAEAVDAYTSCIEADEGNAECRNNVVIVKRKAALSSSVLKEVKENQSGANTAEGMFQRAQKLKEEGLRNEEQRMYEKCLKLDPKFALCYWGIFEIANEEQQTKRATVACKNFVKFADASDYKQKVDTCERYLDQGAH